MQERRIPYRADSIDSAIEKVNTVKALLESVQSLDELETAEVQRVLSEAIADLQVSQARRRLAAKR